MSDLSDTQPERMLDSERSPLPAAQRMTGAELYEKFHLGTLGKLLVGGLTAFPLSRQEWALLFVEIARRPRQGEGKPLFFTSLNGETISRCARSREIRSLFEQSDGIAVDSMPAVFATKILVKDPLNDRAATTDLFHDVAKLAEAEGLTFYLLGADRDTNLKAVQQVNLLYPSLPVVGAHHGYFDFEDADGVIDEINRAKPDILWVCMGVPREQQFCVVMRPRLSDVGLMKTGGGLLDFLSGRRGRAPVWMQKAGLEWLYRLSLEPRRLMRRYLVTNVDATWLLLTRTRSPKV